MDVIGMLDTKDMTECSPTITRTFLVAGNGQTNEAGCKDL